MALAFLNPVSDGPVADSTISVAHDCGSGDDRWLFVAVPLFSAGETPTVSGVSYDGAALSPVVQGEHLYAGNTNVVRAEWWALDLVEAGKTGTANAVVTLSGAADQLSVIAFTATGSGGPSANVNTAGGNLGAYSVAVNTAAATSRVVGLASLSVDRGVTPGSGNTLIEDVTSATAPPDNILAWAGWEQGTGGSDTWDVTLTSAVRSAAAVIELLEAEEGGGDEIIEEVALVAETDTALPLIGQKQRAVAQVAETDTAQAVTAAKVVAVAQVAESDAALAFSRLKVRAVGAAGEVDEALPVTEATGAIIVAVGLVTEMDTALPVAWSPKARLVGLATESDVAQAVTRQKARELGAAAETDAALALVAAKALVLAQATESDLAQGIVRVKRATLAQALERDAALAIAIGGLAVVIDGPTLAALATAGRTFVALAGSGQTLTVLAGTGKTTVDVD